MSKGKSVNPNSKKRSVVVAGHHTSVSLEPVFWTELRGIAEQKRISVNDLVTRIDRNRSGSLSSTIRVFVLEHLRSRERQSTAGERQEAHASPAE